MSKATEILAGGESEAFKLESYVFFWIGQIDNLYTRRLTRALRRFEVNLTCWRSLALLHRRGALTVSELAALSAIERSALGRTIETMEQRGLIAKRGRDDDRRMQDVEITPAGRALYAEVLVVVRDVLTRVTWNVSAAELDQCVATLQKIRRNMSDGDTINFDTNLN